MDVRSTPQKALYIYLCHDNQNMSGYPHVLGDYPLGHRQRESSGRLSFIVDCDTFAHPQTSLLRNNGKVPPPGSKFKHTRVPHLGYRQTLPLLVGSVVRVFTERGKEGVQTRLLSIRISSVVRGWLSTATRRCLVSQGVHLERGVACAAYYNEKGWTTG